MPDVFSPKKQGFGRNQSPVLTNPLNSDTKLQIAPTVQNLIFAPVHNFEFVMEISARKTLTFCSILRFFQTFSFYQMISLKNN